MKKAPIGVRFCSLIIDVIIINIIIGFLLLFNIYLYLIMFAVVPFFYYGICEGSSMSASLGKKILGLMVVDARGRKLSWALAFIRAICKILSGLVFGIGYFSVIFDKNRQALHDKMVNTFVVVKKQGKNIADKIPQITGISGHFNGKSFNVPGRGILFGRDSESCNFVFPDTTPGISRNHCKLRFNPQSNIFILYELGSSHGTFLANGIRIAQGQPVTLQPGEEFYLASQDNMFRVILK